MRCTPWRTPAPAAEFACVGPMHRHPAPPRLAAVCACIGSTHPSSRTRTLPMHPPPGIRHAAAPSKRAEVHFAFPWLDASRGNPQLGQGVPRIRSVGLQPSHGRRTATSHPICGSTSSPYGHETHNSSARLPGPRLLEVRDPQLGCEVGCHSAQPRPILAPRAWASPGPPGPAYPAGPAVPPRPAGAAVPPRGRRPSVADEEEPGVGWCW